MDVTIEVAPETAKPLLRRLLELNAYELSRFDGRDVGPHGEYGYRYLDHYWTDTEQRTPFLFTVNSHIAGFALLRYGPPHEVAEFLVLPKYRRDGVGTTAARKLFAYWSGPWSIHQMAGNDPAVAFWRRAIPAHFSEVVDQAGTTQTFTTS